MKKALFVIVSILLCAVLLGACAKADGVIIENEKLQPTEAADTGKLPADEAFAGDFENGDYTAHIEKDAGGEMCVTIRSKHKKSTWEMSGYFGYETRRIPYDNAAKSGDNAYTDGAGRIEFRDTDSFIWDNDMEPVSDNIFTRIK